MKNYCGIYFLLKNGRCQYIGQSTDIIKRIKFHVYQLLDFDKIRIIECIEDNLLKYEERWIKFFRPPLNFTHNQEKQKKIKIKKPVKRMHFRKLTKKSIVGFGKYIDLSVDNLLKRNRHIDLIYIYFNLSHITFFDDILDELRITEEHRIQKPGNDREKGIEFLNTVWGTEMDAKHARLPNQIRRQAIKKLQYLNNMAIDKKLNQAVNHGKLRS
jgi:hypothetical protein